MLLYLSYGQEEFNIWQEMLWLLHKSVLSKNNLISNMETEYTDLTLMTLW